MNSFKAYLALCRVSNLPTVWTNVLAACLLAGGGCEAASFMLLALALSCFYPVSYTHLTLPTSDLV